jgi:hypothetical protein
LANIDWLLITDVVNPSFESESFDDVSHKNGENNKHKDQRIANVEISQQRNHGNLSCEREEQFYDEKRTS